VNVTIGAFGGEIPTVPDFALDDSFASLSFNVDFRSTDLRSWQNPQVCHMASDNQCITRFNLRRELGACNCCFDTAPGHEAYWSEGLPGTTNLYRSGCAGKPEFLCDSRSCESHWIALGVPTPLEAPVVSGVPQRECSTVRAYTLTYENDCGQEGAPGITSVLLLPSGQSGDSIVIPPTPAGVTKVNIYRLQSTWDVTEGMAFLHDAEVNPGQILTGYEKVNTEADFFFVGSVDATATASTVFADDVPDDCLGRVLTTHYYLEPPPTLRQVQYIGTGRVVGFSGFSLYFSERNFTHAFPPKGRVTVPDQIIAIRIVGNNVFVLTEGHAYVVTDLVECDSDSPICRTIIKADYPYPIRSHRSAVSTNRGVVYASDRGLVLLTAQGESTVLTESLFDQTDWQKISPQTIHAAWWHDTYVMTSDVVSGFIPFTSDQPQFFRTSVSPTAWHVDFEGNLLLSSGDTIYRWSQGNTWLSYRWVSKLFRFAKPQRFSAYESIQSENTAETRYTKPTHISIIRGGSTHQRTVDSEAWCRLPRCTSKTLQVQVRGQRPLHSVSIGTTVRDLGSSNG
jgi:hypothetical protein